MTRAPLLTLALSLGFGCQVENQWGGTSVGNPGEATTQSASIQDASYFAGAMEVESVELVDCAGGSDVASIDATLDPTSGLDALPVAAGSWCELQLSLVGPLELSGQGDAGGDFTLSLELGSLSVSSGGFDVDGDAFVLELGEPGWTSAAALGLGAGDVDVTPGDALHDDLVAALLAGAALYPDPDADGALSDSERASGAVASGGAGRDDEDDDDTDD